MTVTASKMLVMETLSPDFDLPDPQGNMVSLTDFKEAPALLVVFMCNHCPFVKHILNAFVELVGRYQPQGLAVVGINSNDIINFPEDSPKKMAKVSKKGGLYLSLSFRRKPGSCQSISRNLYAGFLFI